MWVILAPDRRPPSLTTWFPHSAACAPHVTWHLVPPRVSCPGEQDGSYSDFYDLVSKATPHHSCNICFDSWATSIRWSRLHKGIKGQKGRVIGGHVAVWLPHRAVDSLERFPSYGSIDIWALLELCRKHQAHYHHGFLPSVYLSISTIGSFGRWPTKGTYTFLLEGSRVCKADTVGWKPRPPPCWALLPFMRAPFLASGFCCCFWSLGFSLPLAACFCHSLWNTTLVLLGSLQFHSQRAKSALGFMSPRANF